MENIIIRSAKEEDLPILYDFEQGIIDWERPFDPTLKEEHIHYYDLRAMIQSSDTEVAVAEIDNEIVGSAYIAIRNAKPYLTHDKYGYLGFMFVAPEHRGKGINKEIIEHLSSWAKTKQIFELRLDVYDGNDSAISAYEKAGFTKHLINMRLDISE